MKLLLLAFALGAMPALAGETVRIAIGTQDTTINCAAGGPVVREPKLLEKYLPRDGKYRGAEYEITWLNLPTGAQLDSEILANRLDIVSMADFPSIVGHDALLTQNNGVKTI
jgi:NitT/TauT family transport system substrate-binding protein